MLDSRYRKKKKRKGACKYGHALTSDNVRLEDRITYIARVCRECDRIRYWQGKKTAKPKRGEK